MDYLKAQVQNKLLERLDQGIIRDLSPIQGGIDFYSNDYLGHARSFDLNETVKANLEDHPLGATGSRLISGNSKLVMDLEDELAIRFNSPSALLFNSGFDLNLGLLSTIPGEEDIILLDQNIHASLKLGAKLSKASRNYFRHNDLEHLKDRLKFYRNKLGNKKNIFVVVESVYSMDGDTAPLMGMVELAQKYDARLIVDEAHGAGIFGPNGRGFVSHLGLENQVFARIVTFGKAFGAHGAVVLIDQLFKKFLVNFCQPLIYTTAMPAHSLISIRESVRLCQESYINRQGLFLKIEKFKNALNRPSQQSPIFSIPIPSIMLLKDITKNLRENSFMVSPIFSPTVKKGTERLRICLHTFNDDKEIEQLAQEIRRFI
ncbi:MAG: 8-amino-7-oxononanoate synthase [Epsilonproteobacteria bacterium]|nr:MAG: 8-amino-7-oxononanoate synthase [Campylobacterota bacterium]RLA66056.1 MAG: 8-amino-7-oxononanoate synthase [Campylobacterota bacterium]